MFIQPTAFQQPLRTIPENKGAVFGIAHFAQLIDANAGISCGFFQRQIAFLPNRNLSGLGPSILLRKTVPSLKSPTGAFIAPLRCANANLSGLGPSILLMQDRSLA